MAIYGGDQTSDKAMDGIKSVTGNLQADLNAINKHNAQGGGKKRKRSTRKRSCKSARKCKRCGYMRCRICKKTKRRRNKSRRNKSRRRR